MDIERSKPLLSLQTELIDGLSVYFCNWNGHNWRDSSKTESMTIDIKSYIFVFLKYNDPIENPLTVHGRRSRRHGKFLKVNVFFFFIYNLPDET